MIFKSKVTPTPVWKGAEKRKFPRINIPSLLEYTMIDEKISEAPFLPGVLYNISAGGLKFGGNCKINIFEKVLLKLNISEFTSDEVLGRNGVFEATAEINNIEAVSDSSFKYGVKFLDIHQGDITVINKLIEKFTGK